LQDGFQLHWRGRAYRSQHATLVLSRPAITMRSGMLQQGSAERCQRLYDLVREVVGIHVAFPDPPLLRTPAGVFV